jgi:hypothetical protein
MKSRTETLWRSNVFEFDRAEMRRGVQAVGERIGRGRRGFSVLDREGPDKCRQIFVDQKPAAAITALLTGCDHSHASFA